VFGYAYYYGGNLSYSKYEYGLTLEKISDGLSNTLLWAEGYSAAKYSYYYDYSAYYGPGSYYKYEYSYTRVWNYDPLMTSYEYTYRYQAPNSRTNPRTPYIYEYSYTGTIYPYFSSYCYDNRTYRSMPYQHKPRPEDANYQCAQSTTSGGLLVCLCDGSVRSVSTGVSYNTFNAAYTPNSGEVLGSDW
jgi:hypothetical protein